MTQTSTATLRCGVVGVGKMGNHHARLWTQVEGCDLVGVVDSSADRCQQVVEKYGGKGYSEVDALIGDPSKVEKALGWKAKTHWKELAELMVDADIAALK